jgi:hypothetical protein
MIGLPGFELQAYTVLVFFAPRRAVQRRVGCVSSPIRIARRSLLNPAWPARLPGVRMLWGRVKPLRARSKTAGFIAPSQAALTDRPPAGPEWSHKSSSLAIGSLGARTEIECACGHAPRPITRPASRIRAAVAALPVGSAVLHGEAVAPKQRCRLNTLHLRRWVLHGYSSAAKVRSYNSLEGRTC